MPSNLNSAWCSLTFRYRSRQAQLSMCYAESFHALRMLPSFSCGIVRCGSDMARGLAPDLCHAHTQILHMLRGCPSPGTAFHLSPAKDAFEIAPGLHVPHLSPACLRIVLLRWTRIGTTAFR